MALLGEEWPQRERHWKHEQEEVAKCYMVGLCHPFYQIIDGDRLSLSGCYSAFFDFRDGIQIIVNFIDIISPDR